jgi:hypothetical protein
VSPAARCREVSDTDPPPEQLVETTDFLLGSGPDPVTQDVYSKRLRTDCPLQPVMRVSDGPGGTLVDRPTIPCPSS